MRNIVAAALLWACMADAAHAQNAITQEGPVLQNSPMMFRSNNRARQGAGVAGAGRGQIIATGDSVVGGRCDYSAPTDDPQGYYSLCFDAATGRITLGGTKTPALGLSVEINGTVYGFPGAGNGNVLGPDTTAVNEVASWNSLNGTELRQGAAAITDDKTGGIGTSDATFTAFTKPGLTAKQIIDWVFYFNAEPGTPVNYDAVRGVAEVTPGTTTGLVNGVGGYVRVNAPSTGAAPFGVAVFGSGVISVNSAALWGFNANIGDCEYRVDCSSTATGRRLVGAELDLSASSTHTDVTGILLAGNSIVQPVAATAIALAYLDYQAEGANARWLNFLYSLNGAAQSFAFVGALEKAGTNISSQTVTFAAFDAAGAGITGTQQFKSPGYMNFTSQVRSFGMIAAFGGDKNLSLAPNQDLASGTSLRSQNDAATVLQPLEIMASGVFINAPVQWSRSTVAGLPPCGTGINTYAATLVVTDALVATYNAIVAGGGSTVLPVFCDGVNWVER